MMSEIEMEEIVQCCSPWEGYTFDPGTYIRAVNYLYDKEQSFIISELREYLCSANKSIISDNTRVSFLLRLLFQPPTDPGVPFPLIRVGKPMDSDHAPVKDFPLYPLVLIEDVPLLIVTGYILAGLPEDPEKHIEFCERHCRLRTTPLRPPDNPLPLVESLMTSKTWYRKEAEHDAGILRTQLLRLVRAVYALPGIDEPNYFSHLIPLSSWEHCVRTYDRLHAVWDEEKNDYKF